MFLDELARRITDAGVARLQEVDGVLPPIFFNQFTEAPDTQVVLVATQGLPGIRVQEKKGESYVNQSAQVQVRDVKQRDASNLAHQIWAIYNEVVNTTIMGVSYLAIFCEQQEFYLGSDANDRYVYGFNLRALKQPS